MDDSFGSDIPSNPASMVDEALGPDIPPKLNKNPKFKGPPVSAHLIQHRIRHSGQAQSPSPLEGGKRFDHQHQHKTNQHNETSNKLQASINANDRKQRKGNSSLLSVKACLGPTGLLGKFPDSSCLNCNGGDGTSELNHAPRDYMASALIHVGKPCRPLAPHRQAYGLQQASSQSRCLQGLSLPLCGEHAGNQAACIPNSRALTFDVHMGLHPTSPMPDVTHTKRYNFQYAVGIFKDMGHQQWVASAARPHQVHTSPRIQAMLPTNGIWHASPSLPCLCATRVCDMDQAHPGSLTVAETVSRRVNGTPKASQKANQDYSIVEAFFVSSSGRGYRNSTCCGF